MAVPSSPTEAGTGRENWRPQKTRRFQRRIAAIHPDARDATGLLLAWGTGNEAALERLVPIVHSELRRIARDVWRGNGRRCK
jgi:hypothetical protein